jgi:hypothetical protein
MRRDPFSIEADKLRQRRKQIVEEDMTFLFDITPYLPAYKGIIPGLIRGDNILITAQSGVGKSKYVRWMIKILRHICRHRGVKLKVFYNSLEEAPNKIYASQVMTYLSKEHGKNFSTHDILHFANKETVVSDNDFELILKAYQFIGEKQRDEIEVMAEPNAFGIYKRVCQFLYETGTFLKNGKPIVYAGQGQFPHWDEYIPNDPNLLVVTVTDTVDKMSATKGKNITDTVHYFSSNYIDTLLAQKCGTINFLVQQQIPLTEGKSYYRGEKMIGPLLPTLDNLRTCKAVRESMSLAFGLFNPEEHKLSNYLGFDVRKMKGLLRSVIMLKHRNGELVTEELPLLLDPYAETFIQLTKDYPGWYEYVEKNFK